MDKEQLELKVRQILNIAPDYKFDHQSVEKFSTSEFSHQMMNALIAQATLDYLSNF